MSRKRDCGSVAAVLVLVLVWFVGIAQFVWGMMLLIVGYAIGRVHQQQLAQPDDDDDDELDADDMPQSKQSKPDDDPLYEWVTFRRRLKQ